VAKFNDRLSRFTYSEAIDRRTKETFAQMFEEIQTRKCNVEKVGTVEGLIDIFIGKKLKEIA
jgi:hypothetical protein